MKQYAPAFGTRHPLMNNRQSCHDYKLCPCFKNAGLNKKDEGHIERRIIRDRGELGEDRRAEKFWTARC